MGAELTSLLGPKMTFEHGRSLPEMGRYIHFGPFKVDRHREEVIKQGVRIKIRGKLCQVLVTLIEKQDNVVSRKELRARLWPAGTPNSADTQITISVSKLRRALGDSWIETVPGMGYRLVEQPSSIETVPGTGHGLIEQPSSIETVPGTGHGLIEQARSRRPWFTAVVIVLIITGFFLGAEIARFYQK